VASWLIARRVLSEVSFVQIASLADIGGMLFMGFLTRTGVLFGSRGRLSRGSLLSLFSSAGFGLISAVGTPMIRSLISKHTPIDEQVGRWLKVFLN
jgi:hypothetical protein